MDTIEYLSKAGLERYNAKIKALIASHCVFRGDFANWASVPASYDGYVADTSGSKAITEGDFIIVDEANDYPLITTEKTYNGKWLFRYQGSWAVAGKLGWKPEYRIVENLTEAQKAALNSGVTAAVLEGLKPSVNAAEETVIFSQVAL